MRKKKLGNKKYYYSIHGLLNIKSDIPLLIPEYFRVDGLDDVDIVIKLSKAKLNKPPNSKIKLADHYCWMEKYSFYVVYPLNSYLILDLDEEPVKLIFSKNFKKFAEVNKLVDAIVIAKLLQKGYAFVHAGAVAYNGMCILLPAMGRVGKTSTVLSLLNSDNFSYMGDNFIILDKNGIAYAYPEEISIYPGTNIKHMSLPKAKKIPIYLKRLIAKSNVLVAILYHKFRINLREGLILDKQIKEKAIIKKVFILNKGEERIKEMNHSQAINQILTGTDLEMNHLNNYYISLYAYLSGVSDFHPIELIEKRKETVNEAIKNAECYDLRANEIEKYTEMIKMMLKDSIIT